MREVLYQRSLALAARHLAIVHSHAGARAGIVGASVMATEHILAPTAIDRRLLAAA